MGIVKKGGKGSGNFGHAGRPGKVGGSAPRGDGVAPAGKTENEQYKLFGQKDFGAIPDFIYSGTPPKNGVERETTHLIRGLTDSAVESVWYFGEYPDIQSSYVRGIIKQRIAKNISDLTDGVVSNETASGIIASWADTSNKSGKAQMIQETIADMFHAKFGTELSAWQKSLGSGLPGASDPSALENRDLRMVLTKMYDNTQKILREHRIEKITLYRGFSGPSSWADSVDESADVPSNALSSWTAHKQVALNFAKSRSDKGSDGDNVGVVIAMDVPAERIFSTALTGFGALPEYEVTLIGSDDDSARVVYAHNGGNDGTK